MITNTDYRELNDGNGSTVTFSFDFKINAATDLKVFKVVKATGVATLMVLNTDYTVTISTTTEGGSITYTVAPTALQQSLLYRDLAYTQPDQVPAEGNYSETRIEGMVDRAVMLINQLKGALDRSILLPITSALTNITMPTPSAGKAVKWNATEDGLENSTYDPDTAVASAEAARDAAVVAQGLAETAKTGAETAQGLAEDAKDDAVTAKGLAETAKDLAQAAAAQAAASAGSGTPIGTVMQWLTDTPPTAFLLCDGSAVDRTTYSALFAIIGTTYGVGNGTTTFNLPNMKGRVVVGKDGAQTEFDVLGETGGAKTHTLDVTEIPVGVPSGTLFGVNQGSGAAFYGLDYASAGQGGGLAHNNLQPYIVVNFIIKYTNVAEVAILDNDVTLAGNSDTKVATQKATKAYVDGKALGSWVTKSPNTVYQAGTDGFVVITDYLNSVIGYIYSDSNNPPNAMKGVQGASSTTMATSMCVPVRKGDYWKYAVTNTANSVVFFIPLGV